MTMNGHAPLPPSQSQNGNSSKEGKKSPDVLLDALSGFQQQGMEAVGTKIMTAGAEQEDHILRARVNKHDVPFHILNMFVGHIFNSKIDLSIGDMSFHLTRAEDGWATKQYVAVNTGRYADERRNLFGRRAPQQKTNEVRDS
jgi:hypothetical protein